MDLTIGFQYASLFCDGTNTKTEFTIACEKDASIRRTCSHAPRIKTKVCIERGSPVAADVIHSYIIIGSEVSGGKEDGVIRIAGNVAAHKYTIHTRTAY